ncbi:MAG: hypothetical protein HY912_23385 [Desulfomonile tiedjei]|uniref:Thioredoxin family protein n=1 Tax=Desulfomonile tiedjei TaxID=2358 RepID=A0A9D6Z2P5_9BACT|nr:hypothetical protein [Desulfomonile tiedjei]
MDTVTYPDSRTVNFVRNYMIPLRVNVSSAPSWASRFVIQYTPTVITLDEDGREHHRTVGFLPAEEFLPDLMLANGKAFIQNRRTAKARAFLERVIRDYPRSRSAQAATELVRKLRA